VIFSKETYVPVDAISKRIGTDVFINVPKIVVGKMGWDEPPTKASLNAKIGPTNMTMTQTD
jgi:ureidoacrylate peracid hydrolase